jgi:hypothetical protein
VGTLIHTQDIAFFDCIAQEVNELAGMFVYYFVLDRVTTQKDALYGEPVEVVFNEGQASLAEEGIKLPVYGSEPEHALTTAEEGKRRQWDGELWVARLDWEQCVMSQLGEDALLHPRNGDVFLAWGKYWDVMDWDRAGILNDDREVFVGWKIPFRRNTKFEPRRRVLGG